MEQLSGADAIFLHGEMKNTPMHIGSLMIYDPSTAKDGFVRFKDILNHFSERLDRTAVFRRKLVSVPMNLDQPYWVESADFDLEFHVRHIALPKPGDWRQLCIQVSRLHSRPMDRNMPLWEAYVIEGLDNVEGLPPGCFAIYLKIHHAAIDGASGVEIIGAIHDLMAEPGADAKPLVAPKTKRWKPEPEPTTAELLLKASVTNMRQPYRMVKMARKIIASRRTLGKYKAEKGHVSFGDKPRTRFNKEVSPHRVFSAVKFSLDDIKAIKNTVQGATVNDTVLSIIGGGLRKYLELKNELPEKSLVAAVPVNVRSEEEKGTGGNMVSVMNVPLRSDVASAFERLKSVQHDAQESKAYHNAVGARFLADISNSLPSHIASLGLRAASATSLQNRSKPMFNTFVTNVPGAQVPLYMTGAKLLQTFGTGPCSEGVGLFHVVNSYSGLITVSFQACRKALPDPDVYERCLQDAYDELYEQALKS